MTGLDYVWLAFWVLMAALALALIIRDEEKNS